MSNQKITVALSDKKLGTLLSQAGTKSYQSASAKTALFKHVYYSLGLQDVMYFKSPKTAGSLATPELWNFFLTNVAKGFPKQAQEMMTMTVKDGLRQTEEKVAPYLAKTTANKKYWRQNQGGVISDLAGRVNRTNNSGSDGKSSQELLIFNDAVSLTKRLQAWEDAPDGLGIDLPDWIHDLQTKVKNFKTLYKFK